MSEAELRHPEGIKRSSYEPEHRPRIGVDALLNVNGRSVVTVDGGANAWAGIGASFRTVDAGFRNDALKNRTEKWTCFSEKSDAKSKS